MPKQSLWQTWNKLLEYQMWNLISITMYCSVSALTQLDGGFRGITVCKMVISY